MEFTTMSDISMRQTHEQPSVTVLIVNLNGQKFLPQCIDSLYQQDYPADRIEIIIIDNGSTDDSITFVQDQYPQVKIIAAGRNLGFAGGNNRGAEAASGDYLALLNNDAWARPDWLRTMIASATDGPECIASKILDESGTVIDFIGSVMNLYGRAFQRDEGKRADSYLPEEPRDLFAPCGGAMLIRRDVFLELGGFDEDYIAYFEDIDLGWRLWLAGYRVLYVPDAVAYHHQHQTGSTFPVEQRYALSEINALQTIIKNYADETLWRVLPFSLFMGVRRSLEQAHLAREHYDFGYPLHIKDGQSGAFEPESKMTRVATSYLVAIDRIAEDFPNIWAKRQKVQATRKRNDQEIFERFPTHPDNPLFPWKSFQVIQNQMVENLNIPDELQPRYGKRLLIITHETVGLKMAGPGIRAWEMACALSEKYDVTLAVSGQPGRTHEDLEIVGYDAQDTHYRDLDPYLANTDVVLAMGPLFARIPQLQDLNKPTIVDLYDPFELEKLAQIVEQDEVFHVDADFQSRLDLSLQGTIGDFFICASERQRDFWLGTLLSAGRVNTVTYAQDATLYKLLDIVPYGISSLPPGQQNKVLKGTYPGIQENDKVLFWNGGLWQWFDPLTLVKAMAQVVQVRNDVKLFFAAGRHFDTDTVPEMPIYTQTLALCRELELLDTHIFFGDWIEYDERGDYLLEADIAVSIHHPTFESRFASRTRLLDCIWAGLPIISTEGDPLSEMAAEQGLGRTVPPHDVDTLSQIILEMLEDGQLSERVQEKARRVGGNMTWKSVVKPIENFLDHIAFAPDALQATRKAASVRTYTHQRNHLREQLSNSQESIQQLQGHHTQLQEHNAQLQEHNAQLQENNAQLQENNRGVGEQNFQRGEYIAQLEQSLATATEARTELERSVTQLELDQESMSSFIGELRLHLQNIQNGRVMRFMRGIQIIFGRNTHD